MEKHTGQQEQEAGDDEYVLGVEMREIVFVGYESFS